MASKWEKKIMKTRPGMNQRSISESSAPILNQWPSQLAKKIMNVIKTRLRAALIRREDEAMATFSSSSSWALTYLIWAFFKRLLLVCSKMVVMARKMAQVPACALVRERRSNARLRNPKKVRENLCKNV